MFRLSFILLVAAARARAAEAPLPVADQGKARVQIAVADDASPAEKHAADELAAYLQQITGATFERVAPAAAKGPAILVGPGAGKDYAAELKLGDLGSDGIVIASRGEHLIVSGAPGAPRGTLYAVYTLLEDAAGVRWWMPDATDVPKNPSLSIPPQHVRHIPRLEYRDVFAKHAFDAEWAVRNKINGPYRNLDQAHGGDIHYAGFVHTFMNLCRPKTTSPRTRNGSQRSRASAPPTTRNCACPTRTCSPS
jgi:hypothetical protein